MHLPHQPPDDSSAGPWTCQLMSADVDDHTVVLDLIALEACPGAAETVPALSPFSLRVQRGQGQVFQSDDVAAWVDTADVVTIYAGRSDEVDWLCLSSGEEHLVLELVTGGSA
jgi:hypothetical protein